MALRGGSRSTRSASRRRCAGAQRPLGLEAPADARDRRSPSGPAARRGRPSTSIVARLERDVAAAAGRRALRASRAVARAAGRRSRWRRSAAGVAGLQRAARGARAARASCASALGGFGALRAARRRCRPARRRRRSRAAAPGQRRRAARRSAAARLTARTACPGSSGASRPASQRSTEAPTSANGPSWRRPPWPAKAASSGTCSRVWSVPGVVGSQPWSAVSTSRSRSGSRRSSQVADRRVDLAQRAVEALDVLAVAVDLVGLDEVGEHEAAVELVHQRRGRRRSPSALVAPLCCVVDADAGEHLADLADGVDRRCRRPGAPRGRSARAAAARGPCGPRCARTRPGSPRNGRAITRPTACSPCMISRAAAQAA